MQQATKIKVFERALILLGKDGHCAETALSNSANAYRANVAVIRNLFADSHPPLPVRDGDPYDDKDIDQQHRIWNWFDAKSTRSAMASTRARYRKIIKQLAGA